MWIGYIHLNELRDEIRFSQQSEDFNEIGRTALQQLYAGKSEKLVQKEYDNFDDLVNRNDRKGMSEYLKKAAQNSYGVTQAQRPGRVRGLHE